MRPIPTAVLSAIAMLASCAPTLRNHAIKPTSAGVGIFVQTKYIQQYAVRFLAGLAVALQFGCASVPPESVDLSRRIGVEISKSQAAHLSTLDAFYKRLNEDNDKWITDVYVPKITSNAISDLTVACKKTGDNSPNCSQLNNNDIKRIIARSVEFRDEMQRALSTNRSESARLINEHYADLNSANSAITALLSSVVDLKKATKESVEVIGKASGIKIDTDGIEKAVGDFLSKAGQAGSQISELEGNLSAIAKSSGKK